MRPILNGGYMAERIFLIGLGHRARNGKDSVANFIKQKKENVIIYHFADPLKEEVMNKDRKIPLIYREKSKYSDHYWYSISSHDSEYRTIPETSLKFLHKIFEDRNIGEYWGMNGNGCDEHKDSLMLQFWGTEWRRQRFGSDYWINKVENYFLTNVYEKSFSGDAFFLLPDTRFINEVKWIKEMNDEEARVKSCYVKVARFNADDTPYYDPDRDPNHTSEIDLEGFEPDYLITAKSGEMNYLEAQTDHLLYNLENDYINLKTDIKNI